MRLPRFFIAVVALILAGVAALAQSEPNLEVGFKPYGSYHGSEIDSVSVMNGNVIHHIRLPNQYPQRGGRLNNSFLQVNNSKNWTVQYDQPTNTFYWTANPGWAVGLGAVSTVWPQLHRIVITGHGASAAADYAVSTWDGASHPVVDVSGQGSGFAAIDGSGWQVMMSNPGSNHIFQNALLVDREGNQFAVSVINGPCSTVSDPNFPADGPFGPLIKAGGLLTECQQAGWPNSGTDANGNAYNVSLNSLAFLPDTMGRALSAQGGYAASPTSDFSGCVSSLTITAATVLQYTGYNGASNQIKTCSSTISLATHFGTSVPDGNGVQQPVTEFPNQFAQAPNQLPVTIVLPDGNKWMFAYDSYGNITNLSLPLGGSISYQYGTFAFPVIGAGAPPLSRAVTQRTITDNNGNTYIWTYQWMTVTTGGGNGTAPSSYTNLVTDPLNNITAHVFTLIGDGYYETSTLTYQGASTSGPLLKRVDTTYQAYPGSNDTDGGNQAVLPISIQTTVYPSGKVTLVEKTYDAAVVLPNGQGNTTYGMLLTEKQHDWGQGSPGAVLQETDHTYKWQSNGAYLTANMLDLPASVVVKDGSGNRMAETDYTYDEPAYLTASHISTQHGNAPASVSGNLTTLSKWLNTSSSSVVSHTNWFDTGEVYQQIDPLGNATTHSYDPTYAGAYATKTCNVLSQCVSGTYDFNTGLLTSFTDANAGYQASGSTQGDPNHTSNYGYDFMSRMTLAQLPSDPAGNRPQTSFTYSPANVFPLTVQRTHTVTASLNDVVTSYYDGLGRVYRTQHATPNGNATVDTTYDGLDQVVKVTNPYYSTSDPTYGAIQTQYDALGRATQVTKQDGSISTVAYDYVPLQAAPGDCTKAADEAGKQRLACADSLGRLIEVHEPGDNFNGTQSQGSLNIGGSLQTYTIPGTNSTYAAGSVTISGKEKSMTVGGGTTCLPPPGGCHTNPTATLYDKGTVTITVNGRPYVYNYTGSNATSDSVSTISSGLQTTINNNSPDVQVTGVTVNATANPPYAVISLQARNAGSGGNFSLSAGATYDSADFTSPSFTTSTSGSSLTGGTNGTAPTTVYDSGTVTVTIGSFTASAAYSQGGNSTAGLVASALAGNGPTGLSRSGSPVTASASSSTITIQYATVGTAGNLSVGCSSATGQGTYFSGPSFTCPATTTLNGGYNPEAPSLDFNYFVTQYNYDALGNLLQVTQKGDPTVTSSSQYRVRTFTYDSLSRLLTATNPESGTISYSYDADANLLQKTSSAPNQTGAATQTISHCYDALNRVTGKAYSTQACPLSSPAVTYSYDGGANGIGHLTSLTDQAGSGSYAYDALGRMAGESRIIAGIQKGLAYTYNLDGSVATLTYPSGAIVTYTPDSAGRMLLAVDGGNNISYVTGATYGPDSGLTGFISGASSSFAGITNSFSYNNRLQPINMSASSPSATVFSISYDFHLGNGDNGNVFGITNNRDTTRNQTFAYDPLNRLITAQNAGTDCTKTTVNGRTEYWGNSYGYDAWGNLLQKTPTKCGAENLSVSALANNQLSGYAYDAAGNITHDATTGLNYSFDQENRITGAAGYTYTYDADGNRVEKSNGSTGTIYWYMTPGIVAESDLSGNLQSEYVFFNKKRIARRDFPGGAVSYYFSDELKTADVITDSAGNVKSESDYYPWGGELSFLNGDSNHYKHNGKERDAETGLDYYGARYYSPSFSRFLTPDWSSVPVPVPYAELSNPQTLNQYIFAHNNPTSLDDPDGHDPPDPQAVAIPATATGSLSEAFWTVGSVALPGLLGGGLAYYGINTVAENKFEVANAVMGTQHALNQLAIARNVALSKDAQAGALIKDGKDANAAATATIEAAIKGIAAGKYKDATDVQTHIDKLKEGMQEVAKATEALKNAVGQKARDAAKEALRKATKEVKGHEKDLRTKPPKPKSKREEGS